MTGRWGGVGALPPILSMFICQCHQSREKETSYELAPTKNFKAPQILPSGCDPTLVCLYLL